MVPFKINVEGLPVQSLVTPLDLEGKPYPVGTVVVADIEGEMRETVINRHGQAWTGDLLPAKVFTITYAKKRCEFSLLEPRDLAGTVTILPNQCLNLP